MNPDPSIPSSSQPQPDPLSSGMPNAPQTRWQPMSRPDVTSRQPTYNPRVIEPEEAQQPIDAPIEVPPAPADQNLFYQPPEAESTPIYTEDKTNSSIPEELSVLSLDSVELNQSNQEQSVINDLELARDNYRHNPNSSHKPVKSKFIRLALYSILVLLIIVPSVYFILIKQNPSTNLDDPKRQSFILPSDLGLKPIEESTALNLINLARQDNSTEIYTNWLSEQAKTSVTQDEFSKLINSYSTNSNGETISLVEKTVGKTTLGSDSTLELNAASLIYKGEQFGQEGPIYTKINIYQDPVEATKWRLYIFEFKSTANDSEPSPLKANLES